jgi:hypothetical protein
LIAAPVSGDRERFDREEKARLSPGFLRSSTSPALLFFEQRKIEIGGAVLAKPSSRV